MTTMPMDKNIMNTNAVNSQDLIFLSCNSQPAAVCLLLIFLTEDNSKATTTHDAPTTIRHDRPSPVYGLSLDHDVFVSSTKIIYRVFLTNMLFPFSYSFLHMSRLP